MGSTRAENSPMAVAAELDLDRYCADVAVRAKRASVQLATLDSSVKDRWLRRSAEMLRGQTARIEEANSRDLAAASGFGLSDAQVDRLRLTPARIKAIAAGLEQVAALPDPVGAIIRTTTRPNGLVIEKVRVPL